MAIKKKYLRPTMEEFHRKDLEALAAADSDPKPPGWKLSPRAVRSFICGCDDPPIERKFYGDDALVERCIVGLAGPRGLMLVGEPGSAKTMLSELLAAAISGDSTNTIQGTAGTTEDQVKYSWNYALLLAQGPSTKALVPAPVYVAMRDGALARFEEITRCPPEIQDCLVSAMSDKILIVPELDGPHRVLLAKQGFNVIATANIRDRGVHEMSSALKRRFNFETVRPIHDIDLEIDLVSRECGRILLDSGVSIRCDKDVIGLLVTALHDLRKGVSPEGVQVERPTSVMSTAEAISVAVSANLDAYYYGSSEVSPTHIARHLAGTVFKDDPEDLRKLKNYFDVVVGKRGKDRGGVWTEFSKARKWLP
jgi:hypothetical protein